MDGYNYKSGQIVVQYLVRIQYRSRYCTYTEKIQYYYASTAIIGSVSVHEISTTFNQLRREMVVHAVHDKQDEKMGEVIVLVTVDIVIRQ